MRAKIFFITLSVLALALGCRGKWPGQGQVVAWVNQQPIYLADYQEELEKNWGSGETSASGLDFKLKLKCLEEMIEQNLILAEAERLKIQVTDQELGDELSQLLDLSNSEAAKRFGDKGINQEKWEKQVAQDLLIRKTLDTVFQYQVYLSDAELKNYYEKNYKSLTLAERARAFQILLPDEPQAQETLNQLKAGADFKELARKYSKSPEARNGGDLGWVERQQLPQFLGDAIFALKPGTVSDLIKSPFGYHILLVEARSEARQLNFEEAKGQIQKALYAEKRNGLYMNWIRARWKANRIKINYQLL